MGGPALTMSGRFLAPCLAEKAALKKQAIDARLAEAEAAVAEEWRQMEEAGMQEQLRSDALEKRRREEAERVQAIEEQERMEAALREEEEYLREVQAQAEAQAQADLEDQRAANESLTEAAKASDAATREAGRGESILAQHRSSYSEAVNTHIHHEQEKLQQAREQNLHTAHEAQDFLQMHEWRQAEQKKVDYDATLQHKIQNEHHERAMRMHEQSEAQLRRAYSQVEKQEEEDMRTGVRMQREQNVYDTQLNHRQWMHALTARTTHKVRHYF